MGSKQSTAAKPSTKVVKPKAKERGPSPASLLVQQQQGQQGDFLSEEALEAEVRARQEEALRIIEGADLLAQELKLEQQLAALDDELPLDDGDEHNEATAGDGDDDDLGDLDPDELAELEGELKDLEREVLGLPDEEEEEELADDSDGGLPRAEEAASVEADAPAAAAAAATTAVAADAVAAAAQAATTAAAAAEAARSTLLTVQAALKAVAAPAVGTVEEGEAEERVSAGSQGAHPALLQKGQRGSVTAAAAADASLRVGEDSQAEDVDDEPAAAPCMG